MNRRLLGVVVLAAFTLLAGRDGGEQREGDEEEHSQQAPVHIPSSDDGPAPAADTRL